MKKFHCVPMAIAIPLLFLGMALMMVILMFCVSDPEFFPVGICYFAVSFLTAIGFSPLAFRRMELYPDKIVCKGMFPFQTYELEYDKCNIGIDYSLNRGRKVWWIYLCYGAPPKYKSLFPSDRIAAVRFRPGFIKMHYREEVYQALIEVLPKKKRESLISAKKFLDREWHNRWRIYK